VKVIVGNFGESIESAAAKPFSQKGRWIARIIIILKNGQDGSSLQ
jgi:hypothetical protein